MLKSSSAHRHPSMSLLYLLFFMTAGAVAANGLGLLLLFLLPGADMSAIAAGDVSVINYVKLIQAFASLGTFLLPVYMLGRIERPYGTSYISFKSPIKPELAALVVLIAFVSLPLIEWTIYINEAMKLPAWLAGVEEWMRTKEETLKAFTRKFLEMRSVYDLLINLVVVAALPAVCEEVFFRGGLQSIMSRWTKNHHWGIWITAALFSAIHLQFYGFLPRMLLGVVFGYLFVWGGSLTYPVIAHFVNNATAVVSAYSYQMQGKNIDDAEHLVKKSVLYSPAFLLCMLGLWAGLLYIFYKKTVASKRYGHEK